MTPDKVSAMTDAGQSVRGACPHDCPDTCALITQVQDGVAISVHGNPLHPHTDGALCTKVSRYTERTYHPDRILHPLKRVGPKGSGQFARVSWEEALSNIAQRLKGIVARGPQAAQAIVPYSYAGTMGLVQGESIAARFFHLLGASLLDRTICSAAGGEGLTRTLGGKLGMKVEQFANAQLIIIWGSNSIGSNLHFWRYAQIAKRKGAKLICIDPRRTPTAEKCHVHIAPLPGTDAALALAVMRELIVHDWLDHDYIEQYTVGWAALRERAMSWTLERAAQTCAVAPEEIAALARDYGQCSRAQGSSAAIRLNYGMQRVRGGGNATRAIACLPALTGAWRQPSGGLLFSSSGTFPVDRAALQRPDLLGELRPRTLNMVQLGNDLLRDTSADFGPRIEALVVYNSNPLAVAPDSSQVVKGLAREDLFTVVLEHFQTDTADYADYILPATTQLEHWDIHLSYGHTDVLLNRPAIEPVGEARPNTEIFRQLARHMGMVDACLNEDDQSLCRTAFPTVDHERLLQHGFASLPVPDAPFAQGRFPTPSGKCEFYSASLAAKGLDPLPDHVPNYEAVGTSSRFPLAMISPPARNFLNSTFVNVTSLRDMEGEPLIEIHPNDAAPRGIQEQSWVRVFNDRGSYLCKASVTPRARSGVVNGLGVWWRKMGAGLTNVNELTSQQLTDLGRGPTFYDCLVQVEATAAPLDTRRNS